MKMDNTSIRSLKMVYYRIYGTNDFFSDPDDSTKIKPLTPVIINDFPDKKWKFSCFLGEVPEDIKNAFYSTQGLGLLCISSLVNSADGTKTVQELMETCTQKCKSENPIFSKYKWYTVEVFEKEYIVTDKKFIISLDAERKSPNISAQESLFDKNFVYPFAKEHLLFGDLLPFLSKERERDNLSDLFNKFTLCLTTEIPYHFFNKIAAEGCVFVVNGSLILGKPKFESYLEIAVNKKYKKIDENKIISLIKKKVTTQNKDLTSISHWYLMMLREEDKWKKFYFGFICLEILTHKLSSKILIENQFDVCLKRETGYDNLVKIPISDVLPEERNRITLASKFSVVAGMLNPEKYSDDVSIFKNCKAVRDKMSHGEMVTEEELPVAELGNLLNSYIEKVVVYY